MRSTAWHDEGVEPPALIDALRAGDREAFARLVEDETLGVYRACLRILGQPADAEDVTQESFMAAYRSIATYRGEGSLRAWLIRIATRLAYRRLGRRRPTTEIDALAEPILADASAEPARLIVESEERTRVRAAVAGLGNPYREVVALRFFGELSLIEIGEVTGRPVNTVKTHLRRGLERLRLELGAATREAHR